MVVWGTVSLTTTASSRRLRSQRMLFARGSERERLTAKPFLSTQRSRDSMLMFLRPRPRRRRQPSARGSPIRLRLTWSSVLRRPCLMWAMLMWSTLSVKSKWWLTVQCLSLPWCRRGHQRSSRSSPTYLFSGRVRVCGSSFFLF